MNKLEPTFIKANSSNLPRIDSIMIASFFATNSDFCSANSAEFVKTRIFSRQSYGDDAIGYVQLKRVGKLCTVKCKMCPEHKVTSKAYAVTLITHEEDGVILSVECQDCAASQGGCKHAVAFLMWVHRRSEEPSCTATECYWKKSHLSKVGTSLKFITVYDLSRGSKRTQPSSDNQVLLKFFEEAKIRKLNDCQLLKYQINLNSCDIKMLSLHQLAVRHQEKSPDIFLQRIQYLFTDATLKVIQNETTDQSNNSLWHELRYGRITASRAYEVSKCKVTDGTLVSLIMGAKLPDTAAMKRGRLLEDAVRAVVKDKLGKNIEKCGLIISKKNLMIAGSPDGICDESVVEIKCPLSMKTYPNYIKDGKIANKFFAQIQLQMYLANLKIGYFCIADPDFTKNNKIKIIEVNFEPDYVRNILQDLSQFWKLNIYPLIYKSTH